MQAGPPPSIQNITHKIRKTYRKIFQHKVLVWDPYFSKKFLFFLREICLFFLRKIEIP
jgi:hypothetical protein